MRIIEALADLVDRFFERADRVNWRKIGRVAAPAFFALVALIAALYAVGLWDFTFIKRPEPAPVEEADTPAPQNGGAIVTPSAPKPKTPDETPSESDGQPDADQPAAGVNVSLMSDLCAQGYYVTSNVFERGTHRIGVLNVDLGVPSGYSVRERNVYAPSFEYEYEYGAAQVVYSLVAEARPSLEAYGGYLFADNGESVVIFDCYGKYVCNFDESMYFAYTRDSAGNPLFYVPSSFTVQDKEEEMTATVESKTYYALTRNGVGYSDYKDEIYSRGVHADLPASYGIQTEPYPRSVVVNTVSHLDLKYKLTGWIRTLWGFSSGGAEPFTVGWYDPEKLKEEAEEAEEEYQKKVEEAKEKGEDPPEREGEKKTAAERFAEAKEAEELWEQTPSTAFNFSEGLACVANYKGQMWFIDHAGNTVIEMKDVEGYNTVGRPVVDNYYLPLTNGIESLGFYYFDHGLVRVRRQSYDSGQNNVHHMLRPEYDDDELIYADGSKFTLAEGYDVISYSDGLILLKTGGGDSKYGFMDYTGAWIVQPELEDAKPFVEGLAPVKSGGKWGVVDTGGRTVIPYEYDSIQTTSSGLIVCHYEGGWTVFAKMALA